MQPFLSGFDWTRTVTNRRNFGIAQILQAILGLTETSETLLCNNRYLTVALLRFRDACILNTITVNFKIYFVNYTIMLIVFPGYHCE